MQQPYLPATMQTIHIVALQYAAILDQLDQQGLNDLLHQIDAEILLHAMRIVEQLDWTQDLQPQVAVRFQEAV